MEDLEFDALFDYGNWTVGVCWGFNTKPYRVFALCLGPLIVVATLLNCD